MCNMNTKHHLNILMDKIHLVSFVGTGKSEMLWLKFAGNLQKTLMNLNRILTVFEVIFKTNFLRSLNFEDF